MIYQYANKTEESWGFYVDIEKPEFYSENMNKLETVIECKNNDEYINFGDDYIDFGDEYFYKYKNTVNTKKLTNMLIKITSTTIITIASVSCLVYLIL